MQRVLHFQRFSWQPKYCFNLWCDYTLAHIGETAELCLLSIIKHFGARWEFVH